MMMQDLICIIPFSLLMHAPVFIRSFSRNDKYHSFSRNDKFASLHFLNHFKNNILLFVLTHAGENNFFIGKWTARGGPFPSIQLSDPAPFFVHRFPAGIHGSIVGLRRVSGIKGSVALVLWSNSEKGCPQQIYHGPIHHKTASRCMGPWKLGGGL